MMGAMACHAEGIGRQGSLSTRAVSLAGHFPIGPEQGRSSQGYVSLYL